MKSTYMILRLALFGSAWLSMVMVGCTAPQIPQTEGLGPWHPSPSPPTIAERQLDPLLAQVSQLQLISRESLDAAKLVGTPDHELTVAQRDYAAAEQLLRDGNAAYTAGQYELSWDKLRAAEAAFGRAEEAAVEAGLRQLEDELAADYGRFLNPETRRRRPIAGAARVSHGSINLRSGAGPHFQIIGEVRLGDAFTILSESGKWYQIQTGTGLVGWVSKTLVTRVSMP